ncbi:MAG TPA: ABC transporter substrate-binding protein [Verrucomicrobiae bacterium]|nr:ABC transporter substrate-binding protein [Verrucomicrobiae bacterium]
MSKRIHLTLAVGDYESIRALKEGSVKPDGIELSVLTDMTSDIRHWRMLRNHEFDVAELSVSNYLMAKYTGLPFIAIPVFLHRRFRHSFIYINTAKNITKPTDLIGKKVGLRNFQATANLWIRGILEHEHGVPHRSINWFKQDEEEVDWTPPADLKIQRIAPGKSVEKMLLEGELDALIHPELIQPILNKDKRVTRLFPNYRDLEIDYYKRTGIFPIMHAVAIKQAIVDKYPWVPINLMQAFEESKKAAYKRMENPRIVPLAWFRYFQEEEEAILGSDPWVYGLGEVNQKALATLMQYSQEQGLLGRKMSLDELFVNTEAHS